MMITRQVRCKKCGGNVSPDLSRKAVRHWPGCYFLLSAVFTHGNLEK